MFLDDPTQLSNFFRKITPLCRRKSHRQSASVSKILLLRMDQKDRRIPAGLKKELSWTRFTFECELFDTNSQTDEFQGGNPKVR
jgi:hypothetical protein